MRCQRCGSDVPLGVRTCPSCGQVDDPTPPRGSDAAFTVVEQTDIAAVGGNDSAWASADAAAAWYPAASSPAAYDDASPVALDAPPVIARVAASPALVGAAAVTGIAAIAGAVIPVLRIGSDAAIVQYLGDYRVNDLDGIGSNFQAALLIAGALVLVGAALVAQPRAGRFGAGLAGGAAAALVPFVLYAARFTLLMSERAHEQAEIVAAAGSGTYFERTLTVGFWLLIVSAAAAVVTLVVALASAPDDGHEPLPTWLCVAGGIACLAAVAGQLIPQDGRRFTDVFSSRYGGRMLLAGRLGMFLVVAVVAVVGFLLASRFGLGLAIGAASLYLWQWLSFRLDVGINPQPPAIYPPGPRQMTMVTTVGAIAVLAACAGLAIALNRQRS